MCAGALSLAMGALSRPEEAAVRHPLARKNAETDAQMFERLKTYHAKRIGTSPGMTIIDVGANRGIWAREALHIWPQASLFMLEANPVHESALEQLAQELRTSRRIVEARIAVLGDAERNVTMHEATTKYMRDTGNSIFRQKSKSDLYRPVERRMRTLDNVLVELLGRLKRPPACVELLKLDVQGAEVLVLQGAERTMRQARFLLLEVSLVPLNENAPLFAEVVAFLAQRGFALVEVLAYPNLGLDRRTRSPSPDLLLTRSGPVCRIGTGNITVVPTRPRS